MLSALTACKKGNGAQKSALAEELLTLDFESAMKTFDGSDTVDLNGLATEVRFVPLQYGEHSTITANYNVLFGRWNGHYIMSAGIGRNFTGVIQFDSCGSFERMIVPVGHGRGELPGGLYNWHILEDELSICGNGMLKRVSLTDVTMENISTSTYCSAFVPVTSDLYVANFNPMPHTGKKTEPYLWVCDRNGEIVQSFCYPSDRNIYYDPQDPMVQPPLETKMLYVCKDGCTVFKDCYNDTVYRIDKEGLSPYIYLKLGSYSPRIEDIRNAASKRKSICLGGHGISRSDRYCFLTYHYQGCLCTSIWDTASRTMVLNTIYRDEGPYGKEVTSLVNNRHFCRYRLPDGRRVIVGILAVESDRLYALMSASDAASFLQDISPDGNPVLMEVML